LHEIVVLSVLLLTTLSCPAQFTPGPRGQATPKNGAVKKGQTEPPPEEAKPRKAPPSTEEWLETIERTYEHSQEDLTRLIEVIRTVFEVLAVVLVIFGGVLGIDIRRLHSQLRHQREAQEKLQRDQDLKYAEFTRNLDQKLKNIQDQFGTQAKDIERRLEQLVKSSAASVFAAQALVLRINHHIDASIENWDAAISRDPMMAYYYWQRAYAKEEQSKFQEGIDDCDKALQIRADYLEPRMLKGYLLIKTRKFSEAVAELEAVLVKTPDDKYTIYNLAVSYGGLRDRDRVLQLLGRLKCYPEINEFLDDARTSPHLAFLQEDPDFQSLVR
jgi:tetratricopeptide (TPR) repeat protein